MDDRTLLNKTFKSGTQVIVKLVRPRSRELQRVEFIHRSVKRETVYVVPITERGVKINVVRRTEEAETIT